MLFISHALPANLLVDDGICIDGKAILTSADVRHNMAPIGGNKVNSVTGEIRIKDKRDEI